MTREDAVIILDCERPYGNCGCGASDEEIEDALNMAIKALEQEPILDKIRSEILEKCFDVPYENQAFDYGLKIVKWSDVREVLDKYKAESEGQTN